MSDDLITHNNIPARIVAGSRDTFQRPSEIHPLKESTKTYQKRLIQQVIHSFGNNLEGKRKASQALGISLSSLYQKLSL